MVDKHGCLSSYANKDKDCEKQHVDLEGQKKVRETDDDVIRDGQSRSREENNTEGEKTKEYNRRNIFGISCSILEHAKQKARRKTRPVP